jgi:hypothetical protein
MRILLSWLPFLVLAGTWIYFMLYFRFSPAMANRRAFLGQALHHLERIEELLTEIATKLDRNEPSRPRNARMYRARSAVIGKERASRGL